MQEHAKISEQNYEEEPVEETNWKIEYHEYKAAQIQ